MLMCYALENRSRWFTLGFAFSCGLGSIYGFLQGAWPFGLVEGIWAFVALQKWWWASAEKQCHGNPAATGCSIDSTLRKPYHNHSRRHIP